MFALRGEADFIAQPGLSCTCGDWRLQAFTPEGTLREHINSRLGIRACELTGGREIAFYLRSRSAETRSGTFRALLGAPGGRHRESSPGHHVRHGRPTIPEP